MRDYDDGRYVVIERDSGGGQVGSFVLGALVGAGLALLFAPKSGSETQEELRARAMELRDAAEDRVREAQRTLEERFDHAREGVEGRIAEVKSAVDQGRQAAVDARGELEEKLERSKAAYRAGVDAAKEVVAAGADDEDGDD